MRVPKQADDGLPFSLEGQQPWFQRFLRTSRRSWEQTNQLGNLMPQQLYSQITDSAAIVNTTTPTVFNRSYSMPGQTLAIPGYVLIGSAGGVLSVTGNPTVTLEARIGGTDIIIASLVKAGGAGTNDPWQVQFQLILRSGGTSAVLQRGACQMGLSGVAAGFGTLGGNFTLNMTVAQTIDLKMTWGTASASNTITMQYLWVAVLPSQETQ